MIQGDARECHPVSPNRASYHSLRVARQSLVCPQIYLRTARCAVAEALSLAVCASS